jgi:hypothetical protein
MLGVILKGINIFISKHTNTAVYLVMHSDHRHGQKPNESYIGAQGS